jgi:hypothetical protein
MLITELIEADEPKKKKAAQPARAAEPAYKEPESSETDWDNIFNEPENKPIATRPEEPKAKEKGAEPQVTLKRGSAADTRRATANITPTDDMRDMMSRINVPMDDHGDDYDLDYPEDIPEPVTPENLPSVISKQIAMHDPNMVNPTWHTVSNLPGNLSRAIRTLGRAVFGAFTRTPTSDITMIGNLGGQGPNSSREVNTVAGWLKQNGREVDTANIDFDATIPGYNAPIKQYSVGGVRFMMVKDQFGDYIYAWPESDSLDRVDQIDQQAPLQRLR